MFAACILTSCNKESNRWDGDWNAMIWQAEKGKTAVDGIFEVSSEGGEMDFVCANYSFPWIEYAHFGDIYYYPNREGNEYRTVSVDWFSAEINGNKLKVSFEPNNTAKERPISLTVTAGDIFYTFKFKQL
jgi:hypothetical protein